MSSYGSQKDSFWTWTERDGAWTLQKNIHLCWLGNDQMPKYLFQKLFFYSSLINNYALHDPMNFALHF